LPNEPDAPFADIEDSVAKNLSNLVHTSRNAIHNLQTETDRRQPISTTTAGAPRVVP
jgi:hypothetical protein